MPLWLKRLRPGSRIVVSFSDAGDALPLIGWVEEREGRRVLWSRSDAGGEVELMGDVVWWRALDL